MRSFFPVLLLSVLGSLLVMGCGQTDHPTATTGSAQAPSSGFQAPGGTSRPAAAQPPATRLDFTLPDLLGQPRQISEWDGSLIVLNFWATWCPPCAREMPLFQERHVAHSADGLTILAVAIDDPGITAAFVADFGIEFPVLVGQDDAMAVAEAYGNTIGALPYTVLIDRSGVVRLAHHGEVKAQDLDGWIREHL
jgi:peroxiredoxin